LLITCWVTNSRAWTCTRCTCKNSFCPERPIAETIQAEVVIDAGQYLPQDQRGRALDHCRRPRSALAGATEIQSQLPALRFPGDLQQHGKFIVGVG
jgi:hypothetical protein